MTLHFVARILLLVSRIEGHIWEKASRKCFGGNPYPMSRDRDQQGKERHAPFSQTFPVWTHRFGMLGQGSGHQEAVLVIVGPMIISHRTVCKNQHIFTGLLLYLCSPWCRYWRKNKYKAELLTGNLVIILYLQNKSYLCLLSFLKGRTMIYVGRISGHLGGAPRAGPASSLMKLLKLLLCPRKFQVCTRKATHQPC